MIYLGIIENKLSDGSTTYDLSIGNGEADAIKLFTDATSIYTACDYRNNLQRSLEQMGEEVSRITMTTLQY